VIRLFNGNSVHRASRTDRSRSSRSPSEEGALR